jgi:flagellar M-ring protein FliF
MLRDLLARLGARWQALAPVQKALVVLGGVVLLATLFYLGNLAFAPRYVPLFTRLDPQTAGAVVDQLKAMKVPYRLADQGATVLVPEKQVYEARMKLASSGVLAGGGKGFELFDQTRLGVTDFAQQVDYQRALQEELRRTIVQLEEVEQARVHLVLPQKSVFLERQTPPSASVVLKLKPGRELQPEQVRGVVSLVAGSVEGLKPENVHVIDTRGRVLFEEAGPEGALAGQALRQQQVKREYERELERRIQAMLERVLGPGKAVAMVTADLDFSQQETRTVTATPGAVVSEQTITERSEGGTGPAGVPGTATNLPGTPTYPAGTAGTGGTYSREETVRNYQVGTTEQRTVQPPGALRRLSASVVVDGNPDPVQEQRIRDVVAGAIGFDANRGDQITVSGMTFDTSLQRQMEEEAARAEAARRERERRQLMLAAAGAGAFLVVLLLALLVRFIRARRRAREEEEEEVITPLRVEELVREREEERPPEVDVKQQNIRDLAREKPEEVAEIIRVWLTEE